MGEMDEMTRSKIKDCAVAIGLHNVKRFGTESTITRQSVAEHSFNVATLFIAVCELLDIELTVDDVKQVMQHDILERYTNDLPKPVARDEFNRAAVKHIVNNEIWSGAINHLCDVYLKDEKLDVFKFCDMLDALIYMWAELDTGNKRLYHISKQYKKSISPYVDDTIHFEGCLTVDQRKILADVYFIFYRGDVWK